MFFKAKHLGRTISTLVGTNTFEYTGTVMKSVSQDVDIRLVPGDLFTVKPDWFQTSGPFMLLLEKLGMLPPYTLIEHGK